MPRDGSGVYSTPLGTDAISDQTIASTPYNTNVHDLEQDLNLPRPIVAGGTGATNAVGARANLQVEVARQVVTNYDFHTFETGSFFSAFGASGAPGPTMNLTGSAVLITTDGSHITLEAIDNATGAIYVRRKVAGVWQAWQSAAFIDNIVVAKPGATIVLNSTDITSPRGIVGQASGVQRWLTQMGNGGSADDYVISRYDNAGALLGIPLTINRLSGMTTIPNLYVPGPVQIDGVLTTSSSIITAGPITGAAEIRVGTTSAGGAAQYVFRNNAGGNVWINAYLQPNGNLQWKDPAGAYGITLYTGTGAFSSSYGYYNKAGTAAAITANIFNIDWTGSGQLWIGASNVGTFTLTSDYRIKKDVTDLASTWDAVKALRPVTYTQAQYTPKIEVERRIKEAAARQVQGVTTHDGKPGGTVDIAPMFEADSIERWGFIAHELQATLIPSAASGFKDAPDIVQSPNPWTVISALTKALQEAMARIEALEAA